MESLRLLKEDSMADDFKKVYTPHDREIPKSHEEAFKTPGHMPTNAIMITVADPETGIPNIMPAVGWGWLNRLPLAVGIAVNTTYYNKDYYPRGTHPLLINTMDFALNIPSVELRDIVTQSGRLSRYKDPKVDKFKELGLTPLPGKRIKAPHIKECSISYECKVIAIYNMGSHDLFLGEIVGCWTDGEVLTVDLNYGEDTLKMRRDDGKIVSLMWSSLGTRTIE